MDRILLSWFPPRTGDTLWFEISILTSEIAPSSHCFGTNGLCVLEEMPMRHSRDKPLILSSFYCALALIGYSGGGGAWMTRKIRIIIYVMRNVLSSFFTSRGDAFHSGGDTAPYQPSHQLPPQEISPKNSRITSFSFRIQNNAR